MKNSSGVCNPGATQNLQGFLPQNHNNFFPKTRTLVGQINSRLFSQSSRAVVLNLGPGGTVIMLSNAPQLHRILTSPLSVHFKFKGLIYPLMPHCQK